MYLYLSLIYIQKTEKKYFAVTTPSHYSLKWPLHNTNTK